MKEETFTLMMEFGGKGRGIIGVLIACSPCSILTESLRSVEVTRLQVHVFVLVTIALSTVLFFKDLLLKAAPFETRVLS